MERDVKVIAELIDDTHIKLTQGDVSIEVDRYRFEQIDTPTSWQIQRISDTATITCNPKLHTIRIEDYATRERIETSQFNYHEAIRKYNRALAI